MSFFKGNAPAPAYSVGTVYVPVNWFSFDDVIRIRYAAKRSDKARWKIGREKWVLIQQMKDGQGCYLWPSYGWKPDSEITLLGYAVDIIDGDDIWMEEPGESVGVTERLPKLCRECHTGLPEEARYCIACGAPVYAS